MAKTHREGELPVAAYLWCWGFKFIGCVPDDRRRGRLLFAFQDKEGQAAEARIDFLNGGRCSAKDFAAAMANLKSQLYEAKDGNGNGKLKSKDQDAE
jgi:hypothetical protein